MAGIDTTIRLYKTRVKWSFLRGTIGPVKLGVFGASGRIGRHVVEQAVAKGHDVTALVREAGRLGELASRVRVVEGSIEDPQAVDRAVAGADAVISAVGADANTPDQVQMLAHVVIHGTQHRAEARVLLRPQLTAFLTSSAIVASSAVLSPFSANDVGHIEPSSRLAASLKPNVA